jgi:ubiquinone/menaquinone biosynthesis C-methylase UbiE
VDKQPAPPNHHADYPGFSGVAGFVAALSMTFARKGDARLAVRLSGMGSGDTVVDIGCGPGVAVRYAARLGAIATGVDPAPVMLRFARFFTWCATNVRYIEGAAEAIPVPESSVSVVWSIATVHHWSDIEAGLREVRRVLLPSGRLVAMERQTQQGARGHASHGWTDEQATAFMNRCLELGFTDVHLERAKTGRRSTLSVVAGHPDDPPQSHNWLKAGLSSTMTRSSSSSNMPPDAPISRLADQPWPGLCG